MTSLTSKIRKQVTFTFEQKDLEDINSFLKTNTYMTFSGLCRHSLMESIKYFNDSGKMFSANLQNEQDKKNRESSKNDDDEKWSLPD